jgi:hypothetical protein
MFVVADTDALVADGIIRVDAAEEMKRRGRGVMVTLAINMVLCFGILAATGGLIFWLADALSVAVVGGFFLFGGLFALAKAPEVYRMLGNAAALIGAGMLMGGAAIELVDKYEDIAGWIMMPGGALVAAIAGRAMLKGGLTARFVAGSILLMGVAMHLFGIGYLMEQAEISGFAKSLFFLYATAIIAGAGWVTDVRVVTALAIVPFAQALETGTAYFHAAYVFYSPEATLSILQMGALILALTWFVNKRSERTARHGRILTVMAFIVANLCALVGSLWGDYVGDEMWGPGSWYHSSGYGNSEDWQAARDALIHISEGTYTVLWAIALAAIIAWAAHKGNRGLFNTGVTFAGIHAYTQLFESFGDEPLAWVIGGFAAIPLAWGMWRLNQRWEAA